MTRLIMLILLVVTNAGCSPGTNLMIPLRLEGQQPLYVNGLDATVSATEDSTILVAPASTLVANDGRLAFRVAIHNTSQSVIHFNPVSNIKAYTRRGEAIEALHVYSFDELMLEAREQIQNERIAAALQGLSNVVNAQQAGQTTTTGTFGAQTYGTYGSASTIGTYGQTTYNPALSLAAQQAAQEQIKRDAERLNFKEATTVQALEQSILRRQSIAPESWHSGEIQVASPRLQEGEELIVVLEVLGGGQSHYFSYGLRREP